MTDPALREAAAFLDRDGVINRKMPEGDYVTSVDRFELLPGSVAGLWTLQTLGYRLIVITNQRGVALGRLPQETLLAIHTRMRSELARSGVVLDAIYFCPHDKDVCDCRKPKPGLLLRAFHDFPLLDPARSVLFGDSPSDIEAARRAAVPAVHMRSNSSLAEAVRAWLG